jgi:hypothetical protein
MRAFLTACLAIVVIAVAADYGLNNAGFSSKDETSAPTVRLD